MSEENKKFRFTVENPQTPRLTILKQPDGSYTITYAQKDPLNLRAEQTANLDTEVARLFGYGSWQDYKNDNLEDLTKGREKDEKGRVTKAPTVHPFHVAYALEEFIDGLSAEQYEIVGVPKAIAPARAEPDDTAIAPSGGGGSPRPKTKSKPGYTEKEYEPEFTGPGMDLLEHEKTPGNNGSIKEITGAGGRHEETVLSALGGGIPDENEIKKGLERGDIKDTPFTNDKAGTAFDTSRSNEVVEIKAAENVINMRKLFFGDPNSEGAGKQAGVLNLAMFEPEEGLINKDVITRAKRKWGNFKNVISRKLAGQVPVMHPSGKYWKAGATSYKDATSEIKEALMVDLKSTIASTPMLRESKEINEFYSPNIEKKVDDEVLGLDPLERQIALGVVQVFDPTGISSWPDAMAAWNKGEEEGWTSDNIFNMGFAALSALPLIGVVSKPVKAAKAVDKSLELAKLMRRTAKTADEREAARKLAQWAKEGREVLDAPGNIKLLRSRAKELRKTNPDLATSLTKKADDLEELYRKGHRLGVGRTRVPVAASLAGDVGLGAQELRGVGPEAKYYPEWYQKYVLGIEKPQEHVLPDFPVNPSDTGAFTFYILPKNWKQLGNNWLTDHEKVLAARVGANTNFGNTGIATPDVDWEAIANLIDYGTVNPQAIPTDQATEDGGAGAEGEVSYAGAHFLVFGHSQAGKFSKSLTSKAEMKGAKVTRKIHSGHADARVKDKKGLVDLIKEVPRKNYTHAFLFLGGNTGAMGQNYEKEKASIINTTINRLGVAKENILVVLPPVNRADPDSYTLDDAKKLVKRKQGESSGEYQQRLEKRLRGIKRGAAYSARRGDNINKEARRYFQTIGVKVHPPIVGTNKEDFLDGYHVNYRGNLASASADTMLGSFSFPRTRRSVAGGAVPGKRTAKTEVAEIIVEEALRAGVDPLVAVTIARIESGLNPLSNIDSTGPYRGLYQFGRQYRKEWAKHGLDWSKVHDARHSTRAFMSVIKKKVAEFRRAGMLKSSTAANISRSEAYLIYLSWQQGSYGTKTIYRAAYRGGDVPDKIQRNMDANTYPKTRNIDPADFLKMWRGKMARFMARTERQYAAALSRRAITETKNLSALFKIIDGVSANEVV